MENNNQQFNEEQVERVVEVFNKLGGEFAEAADKLGKTLAYIAKEANPNEISISREDTLNLLEAINHTMALYKGGELFEAANLTVREPIKVGKGLKTITMRLNGVDNNGNEIEGLKEAIESKLNSFGLTLKKNEYSNKSTYEIFSDLYNVWDSINDIDRANIVELVAGKMHGVVLVSAIDNFELASRAIKDKRN